MNKIEIAEGIELEPFHTLFTGQTNLAGKTTAIRSIIPKFTDAGFTVLVFDTKPTVREFPGYNDIPVTYRPTTDPLVLIGLLEGIFHRRLTPYYSTLGRLTQGATGISDIIENAHRMEKKAKSGFIQDACFALADLLVRLNDELQDYSFSPTLNLKASAVNVMPLNGMSAEAQQLVMKTAFELALKHYNKKTILIIDEAFRFLPQDYSSACKKPVQDVVTQGAKTGLFVWLATQFIATTDKDAIKAMANKFLGRQDDITEIDATTKRVREIKLKPDQLMTLKRGEFIFIPLEGQARKVYIPMSSQPTVSDAIIREESIKRVEAKPEQPNGGALRAEKILVSARENNPFGPTAPERIELEENQTVIKLTHSESIIRETTQNLRGQVIFILYQAARPLSQPDIIREANEHGWAINAASLQTSMSNYVKEGLLVQEEKRGPYRLPRFVRYDVKEIPA